MTNPSFSYVKVSFPNPPQKLSRLILRTTGLNEQQLKTVQVNIYGEGATPAAPLLSEPHLIEFEQPSQVAAALNFEYGQGSLHK